MKARALEWIELVGDASVRGGRGETMELSGIKTGKYRIQLFSENSKSSRELCQLHWNCALLGYRETSLRRPRGEKRGRVAFREADLQKETLQLISESAISSLLCCWRAELPDHALLAVEKIVIFGHYICDLVSRDGKHWPYESN